MQSETNDDSWLEQWEKIVAEVHTTDVPLECIRKIVFKLQGGKRKTVNIATLRRQGLDYPEMEEVVTRMFEDLSYEIKDVDFVVDILAVAQMVQPETDKILRKL